MNRQKFYGRKYIKCDSSETLKDGENKKKYLKNINKKIIF